MTRSLRRKDRALPTDEGLKLLYSSPYGVLATVDNQGQPYGIPLSYVFIDEAIYFHSAKIGHKLDNIANNKLVSFTLVGAIQIIPDQFAMDYESVVAFGSAIEVTGTERNKALLGLLEKYSPEHIEEGKQYILQKNIATKVFRITIERMTGKARK